MSTEALIALIIPTALAALLGAWQARTGAERRKHDGRLQEIEREQKLQAERLARAETSLSGQQADIGEIKRDLMEIRGNMARREDIVRLETAISRRRR
jgi:hypothetical protein